VPLTHCGVPVVPSVFDPYRSCMVAPDHLLFGLAQDFISATIAICSPRVHVAAEGLMRDALCLQNLGRQNLLFSRTSLSLHLMNMSEVLALLLVAASSFYSEIVLKDGEGFACNSEMMTAFHSDNRKRNRRTKLPINLSRIKRSLIDDSPSRSLQE
jgi:hypothetical protein